MWWLAGDNHCETKSMTDLPACRWRGKETNGRFPCSSPRLNVLTGTVSSDTCRRCEVVDLGPLEKRETPRIASEPSLARQAWSFSRAYARWQKAGRPRPTKEQRAEREDACRACPNFAEDPQPRCRLCGCQMKNRTALFGAVEIPGKLDMATEVCPDNPSRWKSLL